MKRKVCPVCKHVNVPGAIYCFKCGNDISGVKAVEPDGDIREQYQERSASSNKSHELKNGTSKLKHIALSVIVILSFYMFAKQYESDIYKEDIQKTEEALLKYQVMRTIKIYDKDRYEKIFDVFKDAEKQDVTEEQMASIILSIMESLFITRFPYSSAV